MYKNGKWAMQVIEAQRDDGSWGYFHSLSEPKKYPMTTEQALKRLEILGYTKEDNVISDALEYLSKCLDGQMSIPDYREKHEHWDTFVELMISTWIKRFTDKNIRANELAEKWCRIITATFSSGCYSRSNYDKKYYEEFGIEVTKQLAYEIRRFYNVSLVVGGLDAQTEELFFDYIMNSDYGIYYVYGKSLTTLPDDFQSKEASRYLGAINMMAEFTRQRHKLQFVCDWLEQNSLSDGRYDMGKDVKDNFYFPLADDWRKVERRIFDCTYRIKQIMKKIND